MTTSAAFEQMVARRTIDTLSSHQHPPNSLNSSATVTATNSTMSTHFINNNQTRLSSNLSTTGSGGVEANLSVVVGTPTAGHVKTINTSSLKINQLPISMSSTTQLIATAAPQTISNHQSLIASPSTPAAASATTTTTPTAIAAQNINAANSPQTNANPTNSLIGFGNLQ